MTEFLTDAYADTAPYHDDDLIMVMLSSWEKPAVDPQSGLMLRRQVIESVRVSLSHLQDLQYAIPEDGVIELPYDEAQQLKKDGHGVVTDGLDANGHRVPAHQAHYWHVKEDGSSVLHRSDMIYAQNGYAHSVTTDPAKPVLGINILYHDDSHTPHMMAHIENGIYEDFQDPDDNPLPSQIFFHDDGTIVKGHYYKRGVETGHIDGEDFENDFVRQLIKQTLHRYNNQDMTVPRVLPATQQAPSAEYAPPTAHIKPPQSL